MMSDWLPRNTPWNARVVGPSSGSASSLTLRHAAQQHFFMKQNHVRPLAPVPAGQTPRPCSGSLPACPDCHPAARPRCESPGPQPGLVPRFSHRRLCHRQHQNEVRLHKPENSRPRRTLQAVRLSAIGNRLLAIAYRLSTTLPRVGRLYDRTIPLRVPAGL